MSLASLIDIGVFSVALVLIGIGVAAALSPAWSSVVVGSLLLTVLLLSRLRLGGREK